jgi:hypothetical protein
MKKILLGLLLITISYVPFANASKIPTKRPITFEGYVIHLGNGGFSMNPGDEAFYTTVGIVSNLETYSLPTGEQAAFLLETPMNFGGQDKFMTYMDLFNNIIWALNEKNKYKIQAIENTPPNHPWKVYYLVKMEKI